jgi:hypothetical protein
METANNIFIKYFGRLPYSNKELAQFILIETQKYGLLGV